MEFEIKDSEPVLPIGVVAHKFNISVHTLRLYEAEGLILPYKTKTNRRMYSQADIHRIACIREMLDKKGLNIAGIKCILSLMPCWALLPCTIQERKLCDAFSNSIIPCWMVEHKAEKCQNLECRDCHVYQSLSMCNNFKAYLKKNWK